jgi:hypothetical protein
MPRPIFTILVSSDGAENLPNNQLEYSDSHFLCKATIQVTWQEFFHEWRIFSWATLELAFQFLLSNSSFTNNRAFETILSPTSQYAVDTSVSPPLSRNWSAVEYQLVMYSVSTIACVCVYLIWAMKGTTSSAISIATMRSPPNSNSNHCDGHSWFWSWPWTVLVVSGKG